MNIRESVRFCGAIVAVVAIASCSRGAKTPWGDGSGLLKYVPADTPYVFAQGEALPDELWDKLQPFTESILSAYFELGRTALADAAANGSMSDEERERASALLDAAADLMTAEGLENTGLSRASKVVIYGNGLLPVIRVTLTDGAKLEATVARIETAADTKAAVATSGGHSYRYWGDDETRVVLAIVGDEVVLTASPTALLDRHLGAVLGDQLPAQNIAASGKLGEIASKYEFGPHYVGFIDVRRIAATFLDQPAGIDADLLAQMDYDRSELSDVCRTELTNAANIAPRMVLGYTQLDAERMAANAVVELRSDIASALVPISAPVPGLGTLGEGLMSVGMGIDIRAARNFVESRLDALEADPFECELMAGIADGIPEMREGLNQPLPPQVTDLRGFLFVLDDVEGLGGLATGQMPSEISARLLLASENAPGLTALAAMFSPEVAALQPNGQPVRINLPMPMPVPLDTYAALTPKALGLAVGRDAEARLRRLLAAPTDPTKPFSSWELDYKGYYALFNDLMALAASANPNTPAATLLPMQRLMTQLADGPIDRETFDMRFTANGIEMPITVTLVD